MSDAGVPAARGHVVLCGHELRVTGDGALHVRWTGHKLYIDYDDRRAATFALRDVQSVGKQKRARVAAAASMPHTLWSATDAECARLAALAPAQTRNAEDAPRPRLALLAHNALATLAVAGACRVTLSAATPLHARHVELKVGGRASLIVAGTHFPPRLRCVASGAATLTLAPRCRIARLRAIAHGTSTLAVRSPIARLVEKTVARTATATILGDPPVQTSSRGAGSLAAPTAVIQTPKRARESFSKPMGPPKKRART